MHIHSVLLVPVPRSRTGIHWSLVTIYNVDSTRHRLPATKLRSMIGKASLLSGWVVRETTRSLTTFGAVYVYFRHSEYHGQKEPCLKPHVSISPGCSGGGGGGGWRLR